MKYMDIREFMDEGYLQEANRQFFHPLGLALSVDCDTWTLGNVWDSRDDIEGFIYADGVLDTGRRDNISAEFAKREVARLKKFGFVIQPVEED